MAYTDTGVSTAATAATSSPMRPGQPLSFCQLGLEVNVLQPLPVPTPRLGSFHTRSDQPRALAAFERLVPPIADNVERSAGYRGDSAKKGRYSLS